MVPILVAITFVAFIAVDWYLRRHEAKRLRPAQVIRRAVVATTPVPQLELSFFVHPGHAWVRVQADGAATVGASAFASSFAGDVEQVEVPGEGTRLSQGEPAWTLVARKGRRLTQVMPVEGEVVAVNRKLIRDPLLVQRSPFDAGWILKVHPTRLAQSLRNLFGGSLAETWDESTRSRLTAMMGSELGSLANDGGNWVAGFGDLIDDEAWSALKRDLFPTTCDAGTQPRER